MNAPKSRGPVAGGLVFGSAALVAFVLAWEGGRDSRGDSVVYADKLAGGLPTVCGGLTRHVTDTPIVVGQKWSAAKCDAEESRALAKMQKRLIGCFRVTPPQSVFDAASSHGWNQGVSATCGSLAMQAWSRGDWALGCQRIYISDGGRPVWSYVTKGDRKVFVQGLANRRQAEFRFCMRDVR